MKALVCEICGGNDLIKQDGCFVCQHCGTKYTPEEAKKLMIEVSGKVTIDNSEKTEKFYELARRAKDSDNAEDAVKYYDLIRQENPNDWEAHFFTVFYRTMQCKVGEIPAASAKLYGCLDDTIRLIKQYVSDPTKQVLALTEVGNKCKNITPVLYANVWSGYQPNGYFNNPAYFSQKTQSVLYILTALANNIERYFGTDEPYSGMVAEIRKCDVVTRTDQMKKSATKTDVEFINSLEEKIQKAQPDYVLHKYIVNGKVVTTEAERKAAQAKQKKRKPVVRAIILLLIIAAVGYELWIHSPQYLRSQTISMGFDYFSNYKYELAEKEWEAAGYVPEWKDLQKYDNKKIFSYGEHLARRSFTEAIPLLEKIQDYPEAKKELEQMRTLMDKYIGEYKCVSVISWNNANTSTTTKEELKENIQITDLSGSTTIVNMKFSGIYGATNLRESDTIDFYEGFDGTREGGFKDITGDMYKVIFSEDAATLTVEVKRWRDSSRYVWEKIS